MNRPRLEPGFATRPRPLPPASAALEAGDRKLALQSRGHLERKYPVKILSEAWKKSVRGAHIPSTGESCLLRVTAKPRGAPSGFLALGKVSPEITVLARRTEAAGAERKPALAALSSSREDVTLIIPNTALSQSMGSRYLCFPSFLYHKKCPTQAHKQDCIVNPTHPSLFQGPRLSSSHRHSASSSLGEVFM